MNRHILASAALATALCIALVTPVAAETEVSFSVLNRMDVIKLRTSGGKDWSEKNAKALMRSVMEDNTVDAGEKELIRALLNGESIEIRAADFSGEIKTRTVKGTLSQEAANVLREALGDSTQKIVYVGEPVPGHVPLILNREKHDWEREMGEPSTPYTDVEPMDAWYVPVRNLSKTALISPTVSAEALTIDANAAATEGDMKLIVNALLAHTRKSYDMEGECTFDGQAVDIKSTRALTEKALSACLNGAFQNNGDDGLELPLNRGTMLRRIVEAYDQDRASDRWVWRQP